MLCHLSMIAVVFVALLFGSFFRSVKGESDENLLLWYNRIFGPTLLNTFADSQTLELAVNETITKVQSRSELGLMGFLCSNYSDGANQAKDIRTEDSADAVLIPFLIDQPENVMCFVSYNQPQLLERYGQSTVFTSYFQETLKIHDSVMNFIFDEYYEENEFLNYFLVIRYRPEFFHESFDNPNQHQRSIEYYQQLLLKLQSYEFNSYETFFWTSNVTVDYFENNRRSDSRFLMDYSRHRGWKDAHDYINEQMALHPENKDPCSFSHLQQGNFEITPGKLVIKMKTFQVLSSDRRLIRSCLGYVTSTFSQDPAVHHISMRISPQWMNFRARSIQQTAQVGSSSNYAPYTAAGLQGDGQIITVADTGADSFSCYFYDPQGQVPPTDVAAPKYDMKYRKIIQYNYNGCGEKIDAAGGHGSHVSGIAAGSIQNANVFSDGMYDGVAPNAKLSISSLGTPDTGLCVPSISQLYGPGYAAGSRVHTNSWGSYFTGNRYYTDQDTDRYLFINQGASIFFAAGNAGNNGDGSKTVTIEACSKNVVAVGSSQTTLGSQDIGYVAFYSSKGPTYDQRIKPDVVSPGDALLSAASAGNGQQTCNTIQMTGTSMASPSAAGAAALIRQYFIDPNGQFWRGVCRSSYPSCRGFTPSGALVKGILAHSGGNMKMFAGGGSKNVPLGASPDFTQGFGRIGFMNVLPLRGVNQKFDLFVADAINIKENEQLMGKVTISNSNWALSATLAWYDPPNVEGVTTKALINNIDLALISPSQQTFYPNGLSNPDRLNNVERIRVSQPQTGTWQIKLSSAALPVNGNQLFSLIITSGGQVSAEFERSMLEA